MITLLTRPEVLIASYALAVVLGWALTITGLTIMDWHRTRAERREQRRLARWRDTQADVRAAQVQAEIDEAATVTFTDLAPERLRPDEPDATGPPVDTAVLKAARDTTVLTGAIVDAEPAADGTLQYELVKLGPPEPLSMEERIAALIARADAFLAPAEAADDWDHLAAQARGGAR